MNQKQYGHLVYTQLFSQPFLQGLHIKFKIIRWIHRFYFVKIILQKEYYSYYISIALAYNFITRQLLPREKLAHTKSDIL